VQHNTHIKQLPLETAKISNIITVNYNTGGV